MKKAQLLALVDDDRYVRESLPDLLVEFGFNVQVFESGEEFLDSPWLLTTCCLILDVAMPGMSGPDLQMELQLRGSTIPIIFITAHGDDQIKNQVLERGAVDCLFKPFTDATLLGAIHAAL